MQTVCIDATWDKEIILGDSFISYLKEHNIKSIALFASVQFLELDTVKKQLADMGITIKQTKAKRTHVTGQILGCDAYHDSFGEDIIQTTDLSVYIGDGMFHPKALLLAQMRSKTIKPVLIWNPVTEKIQIIDKNDIMHQIKKLRVNIMKFLSADTIGLLVTVKPGQQYLKNALKLKEKWEKEGKSCYIFIDDDLSIQLLENYPFIDVWVNTACPRIGTDDITTIEVPLVNIRDVHDPIKTLDELYKE
ncbi:MAG: diphthamide synthesis protein [Candidatus Woesearchaeota archaeon]